MYIFLFVLHSWPQIPLAQGKANSLDILMKTTAVFLCNLKESFAVLSCILPLYPASLLLCFHSSLWTFVDTFILRRASQHLNSGIKPRHVHTPLISVPRSPGVWCGLELQHAAKSCMLPDPHPREADLDIAGTEKTGLWNNENVIKVKSKGTACFFFKKRFSSVHFAHACFLMHTNLECRLAELFL